MSTPVIHEGVDFAALTRWMDEQQIGQGPSRANSNDTMRREARVLAALSDTAVPHPKLIAACSSEEVLGAAFYLMEPVDGFNATVGLPALHASDPAIRRRMGLALIEGIAALGRVDHVKVGLSGLGRPENFLTRQVERWRSQFESYRQFEGWPGGGIFLVCARWGSGWRIGDRSGSSRVSFTATIISPMSCSGTMRRN